MVEVCTHTLKEKLVFVSLSHLMTTFPKKFSFVFSTDPIFLISHLGTLKVQLWGYCYKMISQEVYKVYLGLMSNEDTNSKVYSGTFLDMDAS